VKRLYLWSAANRAGILLFFVLFTQGALLGLSDDEAYYWVLAQKPALGYAYHPPAVAWFIAFFQKIFGGFYSQASPALVRLPAALSTSIILGVTLNWLREIGLSEVKVNRAAWVLVSFFGFFALAWMMVPDIPLLLGWTLLFVLTWKVCFSKPTWLHFTMLGVAAGTTLLSKYSGVLAIFSAAASILFWAPRKARWKGWSCIAVGTIASLIPILIWNAEHAWGSILYQIRDRHGGSQISWIRYLRFWIIEAVLAGPILVGFGFILLRRGLIFKGESQSRLFKYFSIWIFPAACVFCVQPLFADFKPHWAFVVWWPVAIALAWEAQERSWTWIRYQVLYGVFLGSFILLSCHIPIGSWIARVVQGPQFDPRLDVTNDFYGWSDLGVYVKKSMDLDSLDLPVTGSRYQTASQAAFSLNGLMKVTLLPRDLKERDEWPNLSVSEESGPGWPKLKSPVLYVTDNRYTAPPEFPSARCRKIGRFEKIRHGYSAKWIEFWRCDPGE
jgi:4-amino-4-deoxy-L-arabinose transferase-like glycosyltransferase